MLVIGRKVNEYVVIDDNIKVRVVRSKEGHLRLAIDAPREIPIVRGELWERAQLEEQEE
ncbi:carbon storage regulator [Mangrovibacillus cuniculi]|uniref:Translational regulator CsrA n=1 Tax=Mangrovibacillus cuniculi TaxID=2593652 RepID=A0A7S8HG19_9BACI|nr:carbon storage regulator [Mangrovibacillus cuniculi]QPC47509.1 carbon storage regulator [Mangrovibacillus cuniculi]